MSRSLKFCWMDPRLIIGVYFLLFYFLTYTCSPAQITSFVVVKALMAQKTCFGQRLKC